MANLLTSLLTPSKSMGTGMAEQGRKTLDGRAYQLHVAEAKANGVKPMTPEEFAARQ